MGGLQRTLKDSQLAVSNHVCKPGVGKPVPRRPAGFSIVLLGCGPHRNRLLTPGVHHWGGKDRETLEKCGRSNWAFMTPKGQMKSNTSPR